jgi:hypothetical protein
LDLTWVTSPVWLILNALVAFRLARLWIDDELPPLPMIRQRLDRWADLRWHRRTHPDAATQERWHAIDDLKRAYHDEPPVKRLWDCYWCAGFWITVGVFLAASLIPLTIWALFAVPLALSAVVGIIATRT